MSKRLNKYIASFVYFDKSLIVLSIKTGSISIVSFATVIASLAFSISTGIIKKLLKNQEIRRKNTTKLLC